MITKVSDTTALPTMTAAGYVGQSAEELKADLALRRTQLIPDPIEKERLRKIGTSPQGDIYVDLLSFMR